MAVTLVQLTDCHLLADRGARLRGWPVAESLAAVVGAVGRWEVGGGLVQRPDRLLLTGDLADSGEAAAYEHLLAIVAPLNLPIDWLPGNHDAPAMAAVMAASVLAGPVQAGPVQSVALGRWRLLLLDSVMAESPIGEGALSEASWRGLEAELARWDRRGEPTVIALHHPPLATGLDWVDQMQLRESDRFVTLVAHYPQVKLVVFGHIHAELHRRIGAVDYYGCPSTCRQVEDLDRSNLDGNQPGFRVIQLEDDGQFSTWINRVLINT